MRIKFINDIITNQYLLQSNHYGIHNLYLDNMILLQKK